MDSVQSMASSSSTTVPSSERTSHFISQTEIEMESSKTRHWSQLDYSTTDSEWSAETNFKYFELLKEEPQWGRFFTDFEALEVGEKISGGAQADIYEARNTRDGPFNLVVKVMKGDAPLKAFQAQWPIGMLSARSKYKHLFDLPLIAILGGTVLRDKRLRGRFAFVMYRRWGDLRLLIDRRMKQERSTHGPFSIDEAIHLMLSIAEDMEMLHDKHDILHRDLKASNVLVWGEFGEDMSLIAPLYQVVADFECSVGVLGTGFWRAPEILEQLRARVPSSKVQFTRASDVYSYGMTCYEIVTGCIPYDGLGGDDTLSKILKGRHPEVPQDLPESVRNIIVGCLHSDPTERPTFAAICVALKRKTGLRPVSVVIDNKSRRGASIVKVEQWNNPQPLTLLIVMLLLIHEDLSVLKASYSSSTEMITQYFEVTDCKGGKVVNAHFIANITKVSIKALSSRFEMEWNIERLGTSADRNTIMQMHVVEVVAEWSTDRLRVLSGLLVATNFRIHSAGCRTRKGRFECVMYVEGVRMGTLLWELRRKMDFYSICRKRSKIIVHRVAAEELSQLNRRLHNLKLMDLRDPRSSSTLHVSQRKEPLLGTRRVVCLGKPEALAGVSGTLVGMNYRICQASIEYPGPFKFLKGRANKREDIDVGTCGNEEMGNMKRILDVAIERGCPEVNVELAISGPSEELHDDLMRSLRENGLVVTSGQVCNDKCSSTRELSLQFFVTENPAAGAG